MIIYKITNKFNAKIIVGKTTQKLHRRWSQHKNPLLKNKHSNPHLQNAWNMYGEKNFEISIIEICESEQALNERETFWIKELKSFYKENGYNMSLGGEGQRGWSPSPEWREAKRKLMTGKKYTFSEEHKKRISESRKGITLSKETIAKIKNTKIKNNTYNKGVENLVNSQTKEQRQVAIQKTKQIMSERFKNLEYKTNFYKKIAEKNSLEIQDQNGKVYASISEAAKEINSTTSNICKQLKGRIKHNRGYIFKYRQMLEDEEQ